jgi:hypothetical protein
MNRFQKLLAAMVAAGVCLGVGVNGAVAATNAPVTPAGPSVTAAGQGVTPTLTYSAGYLLKMYQSGLNEDTLLSYINSSPDPYSLSAQDVAYFQNAGVPATLTQAMVQRDADIQQHSAAKDLAQAASQAGVEDAILLDPDTVAINPGAPPLEVTVIGNGTSYDLSPGYGVGDYAYNEALAPVPVIIAGGANTGPVSGGLGWSWGHHGGFRPDGGIWHVGSGGGFHGFGGGAGSHGGGSGGHHGRR